MTLLRNVIDDRKSEKVKIYQQHEDRWTVNYQVP